MISEVAAIHQGRHGDGLDEGMAGAAAQLRQLVADYPNHQHAQMLSAIAALIDALLVDGATRH